MAAEKTKAAEDYRGPTIKIPRNSIPIARLEIICLRLVEEGDYFLVQLFSDITEKQLYSQIRSRFLPPFWGSVLALQGIGKRENGVPEAYQIQINSDYLRTTAKTFSELADLFFNIGEITKRWKVRAKNSQAKTLVLQLEDRSISLTEHLILSLTEIKPRSLTEQEKQEILKEIPPIRTCDDYASELHHQQVLDHVYELLETVKLSPVKFQPYKRDIVNFYLRALYQPYEKLGITTTDSICAPVMQGALNSRHKFGASTGIGDTIEQFEQILLNQNIKSKKMRLYPTFRQSSEDDMFRLAEMLEQVTFKLKLISGSTESTAIVGTPDILAVNSAVEEWWEPYVTLSGKNPIPTIDPNLSPEMRQLKMLEIPQLVLVVKLNMQVLFEHNLTLAKVAKHLETVMPSIFVMPSPVTFSIVDLLPVGHLVIFPVVEKIWSEVESLNLGLKKDDPGIQRAFLSISVLRALDKMVISGLPGVTEVVPQSYSLSPLIFQEAKIGENLWQIELNRYQLRRLGLTAEDFLPLLNRPEFGFSGVTIQPPIITRGGYSQKYLINLTSDTSPAAKVKTIIQAETQRWEKERKEYRKKFNPLARYPLSPLLAANTFNYAVTRGSNLEGAITFDEIDPNYSYSNDPKEMVRIYGIEIAYISILRVALDVMQSGGMKIDISHLLVAAEYQCNQGLVLGLDYHGLDKRADETFAKASVQKAESTVSRAAATGRIDSTSSVSSAVLMGSLAGFGAANVKVGVKPIKTEVQEAKPIFAESAQQASNYEDLDALEISTEVSHVTSLTTSSKPEVKLTEPAPILDNAMLPPEKVPAKTEEENKVVSNYTNRAAVFNIPISQENLSEPKKFELITLEIPEFRYKGLPLPKVIQQILLKVKATLPIVPTMTPAEVAPLPKLRPLSSLARLLKPTAK